MNKQIRKALIDSSFSLIFWMLQVAIVIVILTQYWSWEQYFSWLPAYLFLSFPFTPLFGRCLNYYRRMLRYEC